ncbi:MAG TPA: virulence factor [Candidatus Sulfomarinibacteraceae bacterium]|nr:virulence factor [Candidatus Sulfomarinibacteraceae bacterium]
MARYQILYWKEFPAQVKAWDEDGSTSAPLPHRFERAVNVAAMVSGDVSSDAYLEGWEWGPEEERPGSARDVAQAVAAEIEAAYSFARLQKMVRAYKKEQK